MQRRRRRRRREEEEDEQPPTQLTTVIVKGRAPVDDCCPVSGQCHVIEDSDGVYDAALNQTNIGNNNNKVTAHRLCTHRGEG